MKAIEPYRQAMERMAADLAWAEVNAQARESLLVGVQDGAITRTDANAQSAFYVRASGGRAGYAYTQNPQDDAQAVLRQAIENGLACETERANVLGAAATLAEDPLPPEATIEELAQAGDTLAALAKAADPRILQASADLRMDTLHAQVLNTNGLDAAMARRVYAAEVSVLAGQDDQQVNASAQVTAASLAALDLQAAADRAAFQASMQLGQRDLTPGVYPVVLDSSVAINILVTAWQLFSASKYIDGASALSSKLGQAIGSPALTIRDVPAHAACGYRFPLDDEGTPATDTLLVDRGTLTGLMHTRATAAQMNTPPTGNSGRVALLTGSIPTELIVVPKIITIEPGTATQADLLAAMNDGIWITRSFDIFHSVNVGSGDFAIPCSGAVIRGGKLDHTVGNLTICGNLCDLFMNIEQVGSDLWIDEFLLKSYCMGAPSLRVKALQVNGRG